MAFSYFDNRIELWELINYTKIGELVNNDSINNF